MTRLSIRVGGRQRISHASSFHFIPRTSSGAQASAHSRPTPPPPPPLSREWRVVSSGSSAAVKGSAIPRYSSILPPISLENYVDESPNSSSPLPLPRYHSTRNTLICNSPRSSRIGESRWFVSRKRIAISRNFVVFVGNIFKEDIVDTLMEWKETRWFINKVYQRTPFSKKKWTMCSIFARRGRERKSYFLKYRRIS